MKTFRNANFPSFVFPKYKIMFRLVVLILFFPAALFSQERTFGNGTLPEHLALYDVDESGGLSEEELQILREDRLQRQKRLRNRWDLDRNGKISDQEREAAKTAIRQTIRERRVQRFNEADLDRDGQLTLTEFRNITAVNDADTNSPGLAERLFSNLDSDNNTTVSTREFLLKLDNLPPVSIDEPLVNKHPRSPLGNTATRPR